MGSCDPNSPAALDTIRMPLGVRPASWVFFSESVYDPGHSVSQGGARPDTCLTLWSFTVSPGEFCSRSCPVPLPPVPPVSHPLLSKTPWQPLSSACASFPECPTVETLQEVDFSHWLLLLGHVQLRGLRVVLSPTARFSLGPDNVTFSGGTTLCRLTPCERHLGCFHLGAIWGTALL